jgi:hypothetical protein
LAANPYDDILAAPSSVSAGGPAANPYDDILGGEQVRQQAQLRANVSLAADTSPDAVAAKQRLATYVGYKPAVGEALPDEIKAMATVKRVADDTAGSPVLQKAYTDADFARIGHDDSGALSAVGEAVASLTKYLMGATPTGGFIGALKATPALAAEGILGAKKAMVDVVEPWARLATQNPDNTFSTLSKYYSARSAEEKAKAEALSPADNSIIGGGLQAGFQSLGGNSKYLPLAFLPGGAPFALAGMGIETFGHSYNRAADKNIPLMARLLYAASDATIEVATETGPLGALVHGVKAGAPFVRTMLTNAIKENKGEQVATLLQDANEWAVLNPDKPFVEYLKERPAAAVQTLIATLVGVGGNTALAEGVQRASDAVAGRQRQIDLSLDQVDKLQGLFKAALDSKVRERDPVSFGNLVQQMAEATPGAPANVFIDARALTDALAANPEAAGVFNQMPAEVQAQVQEALATGGAVEIPLGDLVSKGAGTALEAALLPHIRTSLDGLSQTEAKDAAGQAATYLQQEADRVIAESDRSETIAASADAVHSQVLDQLNAINRNTPDVNGAYATLIKAFYTATSARLGMTPEEMYAKHPLSIKGETVGAGYNSQTGAFGPRFQQFKGDAAGAIAHLVQQQDGEAIGALHHPDLGDIDLVWGEAGTGASDGYGLAKLLKWHPEVVDGLQEILSSMKVASRSENRIRLESADHAASVRLSWDGQAKHWLLTAYEKRGDTGTRTDTADTSGGDDTARPTDASESIVDAKLQQYYQGELNQSDSKVHNLTSTAERGNRVEGTRSMLSGWEEGKPDATSQVRTESGATQRTPTFGRDALGAGLGGSLAPGSTLGQQARGTYNPATLTISLLQTADLSTFLHEAGHFFLEVMADLASQENAPEQITADFGKILKWFGVKDAEDGTKAIDVWRAMTLDEKRPHHERWAESFEQYLIEGKAPSLELRGPFQRFRGWLTTVYKSLRDFAAGRDLKISGEIRAVMDRLVATEDQISEAEQQAKYEAVYKTAEEAGMDEHEWAVYQAMHQEGTDAAIDQMQARSISDLKWAAEARSKALRQAQRAVDSLRKAMRVTVTEEVMASPIEQARAWIKDMRQSTPEQKAALKAWTDQRAAVLAAALAQAKADLIAANPDAKGIQKGQLLAKNNKAMANQAEAQAIAWEQDNRRPTPVLPAIEMDSVAERFGFTSGDELTKKMASEPSAKDTIDGLTEQRLMEEHGELITPQGVQQAANEAIHNEARARFVATELATLQHAMNQKAKAPGAKVATNVLVAAAKQFAQAIVGRRKISDLKPGRYTAAETRAAAAVQKAMAAGDQAAAVAAQRDKLLNLFAAKETVSARDELIRAVEYLRKFERDSVRSKLPPEYLDQIDALLEKFDLKAATTQKEIARRKSLASWLASQQDLGIEPNIPRELIDKAGLTSYKDLTVDEMRGLVDTIKQIEHLARLKSKLLTARDQREYAAIRDEIAASINHYAGDRQADTRTPTTNMGRWFQAVKNFGAAHIKAATWARVMDGGKAGGPVWEYFIRPANERGDMETKMRAEAAAALHEIIAPWLKGKPAGGKGVFFPTIGRSMNRESILALALNTGNEGNLQRLLGGENWALQDIKPVLDTLSRSDWEVVQKIWDHFESYRPLIGAKEMRVYGKEPDWIKPAARQFTLADGTTMSLAGGYYPIKYDPAASVRAEEHADAEGAKRLLKGAYGAATTSRSFTKARVEEVVGRPLLYTLSGLYSGVNDVIHDLAWHEWLIDANRLLKSQTIDSAIREHYGPEAVRQLKSWRDAIAEGDAGSDQAIDAALGRLRQGVSVAGLGFNVMSAMMQPLGMTQSIVRVGAKWIGRGSLHYIANPRQATREVQAQSDFMASRARTQFRELNEIRNTVQGQTAAKTVMTQTAYYLMMQCQQMVDVPTWLGAYEKAMSEGNDDERSVALADQAVIDAQGGGMTKDLSAMERGGPAQKLFTVFYSFMNTALNLGVGQAMTSQKTTAGRAKLAADMLMLYSVPAVLGALLKDALTPGDSGDSDDWRKLLRKLIGEQLTFLLGLMVVAREFGEVGKTLLGLSDHPRDYAGPAGVRLVADAGNAAKQIQQGEFDDQLLKAVINLAGDIFGLPAAQVNRTITGFNALKEGKTHNPAALAFGYQEPH